MKRLLLVSYYYPPSPKARSIRMLYFTKYLLKKGYKVDVLTSFPNKKDRSVESLLNNVENKKLLNIYTVKHGYFSSFYDDLKHSGNNKERNNDKNLHLKNIKRQFKKFIPRPEDLWYFKAIKKGEDLVKNNQYDFILSSAKPIVSHIVSLQLSCMDNIPLILEYGDPWSIDPLQYNMYKKIIEKKLLTESECVILTTDETKQFYQKEFPDIDENKFKVVYSGYDKDIYDLVEEEEEKSFDINYTGNIHEYRSKLKPVFKAVEELNRDIINNEIKLNLIGGINVSLGECNKLKNVNILGRVPFLQSIKKIKGAHVLLLLGNKGGIQVPMKTFWYMGAKKPIIVVLGDENDPLKKLLADYDRAILSNNTKRDIKNNIHKVYELYQSKDLETEINLKEEYGELTWDYQLSKLDDILKNIMK